MKRRYVPIITLTIAMVLVGSIAYAADRRKQARLTLPEQEALAEEALKAELLAATGEPEKLERDVARSDDVDANTTVAVGTTPADTTTR